MSLCEISKSDYASQALDFYSGLRPAFGAVSGPAIRRVRQRNRACSLPARPAFHEICCTGAEGAIPHADIALRVPPAAALG